MLPVFADVMLQPASFLSQHLPPSLDTLVPTGYARQVSHVVSSTTSGVINNISQAENCPLAVTLTLSSGSQMTKRCLPSVTACGPKSSVICTALHALSHHPLLADQANALRETQLARLMADYEPALQGAALASAAWLSQMDVLLTPRRHEACTLLVLKCDAPNPVTAIIPQVVL